MISSVEPALGAGGATRTQERKPQDEFKALCARYLPASLEDGVIILVAGPAAGKGTQAEILSQYWNIPTISIGSLLRERSEVPDAIGREVGLIMEKGGLVRNEIVFDLLKRHLEKLGNPKTFILDGCPRSMDQVGPLNEILAAAGIKNISALYLETSLDTALARSKRRREKDIAAGKKPRKDDKPKTVKDRYASFKSETLPVLEPLEARRQVARADVNADALVDNVRSVVRALGPIVKQWKPQAVNDLSLPDRSRFTVD